MSDEIPLPKQSMEVKKRTSAEEVEEIPRVTTIADVVNVDAGVVDEQTPADPEAEGSTLDVNDSHKKAAMLLGSVGNATSETPIPEFVNLLPTMPSYVIIYGSADQLFDVPFIAPIVAVDTSLPLPGPPRPRCDSSTSSSSYSFVHGDELNETAGRTPPAPRSRPCLPTMQNNRPPTSYPNHWVGRNPLETLCPACGKFITSDIKYFNNIHAEDVCSYSLFCFCFWPCLFLPYWIRSLQDVEHSCPKCKAYLGTFRAI